MPRNVRNFWITVTVDGRVSKVEAGPEAKDGGFKILIQQRENGVISNKTMEIVGQAKSDGTLLTGAFLLEDRKIVQRDSMGDPQTFQLETKR